MYLILIVFTICNVCSSAKYNLDRTLLHGAQNLQNGQAPSSLEPMHGRYTTPRMRSSLGALALLKHNGWGTLKWLLNWFLVGLNHSQTTPFDQEGFKRPKERGEEGHNSQLAYNFSLISEQYHTLETHFEVILCCLYSIPGTFPQKKKNSRHDNPIQLTFQEIYKDRPRVFHLQSFNNQDPEQ